MVQVVTNTSFEELVEKCNIPVVIDFWATWCGPCRGLAPVLEELSEKYKGKFSFVKIDVDENQELAEQFALRSVPTLVIYYKGKVVDTRIGGGSKENVEKFLEVYAK